MWYRLAFIQSLLLLGYYLTYFGPFTTLPPIVIVAIFFGATEALFSIHIMHDACHASITHNPKVWKYIGSSFDFQVGASFFAWVHQHVIGHHLYTNVQGADPDIGENEVDFRRVSPVQQWFWFYKFQHIYAPIVYGLLTFKYRLQDWQAFVLRTNGQIRVLKPSDFHVWAFILGKVSHVATGLQFLSTPVKPNPSSQVDDDWAMLQVTTTQDYSHGNKLLPCYQVL